MAQIAAISLLKSVHKMYENRDNADFVVKSIDGKETRVHSFLLIQASEVLEKMVTGDFKEKNEKMIELPNNDAVIALFVRFLYGFELPKEEVDIEVAKELLIMAGVYDVQGLKKAVGFLLNGLISKENVFDMWTFSIKNEADDAKDECGKYIVANFERRTLIETGKLKELPDLGNWIVEDDYRRSNKSNFNIFNSNEYVAFSSKPITCSLQLIVDSRECVDVAHGEAEVNLTGIGLSILPGSNVEVEIQFMGKTLKHHVVNNTVKDRVPIIFEEPIKTSNSAYHMSLSLIGVGLCEVGKVEKKKDCKWEKIRIINVKTMSTSTPKIFVGDAWGSLCIAELYFGSRPTI